MTEGKTILMMPMMMKMMKMIENESRRTNVISQMIQEVTFQMIGKEVF